MTYVLGVFNAFVALMAIGFVVRAFTSHKATIGTRKVSLPNLKAEEKFWAVSIESVGPCCEAVKELGDERLLVDEAPELPLPGCDLAKCGCVYHHYEDRRAVTVDRRLSTNLLTQLYEQATGNLERRRKKGRRKADWV